MCTILADSSRSCQFKNEAMIVTSFSLFPMHFHGFLKRTMLWHFWSQSLWCSYWKIQKLRLQKYQAMIVGVFWIECMGNLHRTSKYGFCTFEHAKSCGRNNFQRVIERQIHKKISKTSFKMHSCIPILSWLHWNWDSQVIQCSQKNKS